MTNNDRFICYLYALGHESTGVLAALRRACAQRLAESANCQWFASISTRPADFLTATLVAQYSAAQIQRGKHHATYRRKGSIGTAWAEYCGARKNTENPATFYAKRQSDLASGRPPANIPSIHERFRTLLDAELQVDGTGELAYRLRGLVRMLVAKDIPIDVVQLAYDLRGWRSETRFVQERWAKAFYSPPASDKSTVVAANEQGETEELETQNQEEDDDAD